MNTTPKRVGRKPKSFKTAENKTIDGLMRQPDGRWKIIVNGFRFTEPDEKLAIARFYRLTGQANHTNQGCMTLHCGFEDWPEFDQKTSAMLIDVDLDKQWAEIGIPEALIWAKVRRELLDRPQYVASAVGIEQLGYLSDIKKPEKLPSLDELEALWKNYAKCSKKQITKVLRAWQDFCKQTAIKSIKDITAEVVVAYRDTVHDRKLSAKQQQHIFGGVRRVLSFAKSRAVAVNTISDVMKYLSILASKENATSLDPHPISPEDFKALLDVANDEDRAMLLLMLNGAFYLQEVVRLTWSDVEKGTIVTRRTKTGHCIRVCVLWPETINALSKLQKIGPHIFTNWAGQPLGISGAHFRFANVRTLAKRPHVCSGHLRDGAYTASVEANVSENLCRLLVGHRAAGLADHYVARSPHMVAPACDAIRAKYFTPTIEQARLAIAG